jgi:hypothetical protein
MYQYQESGLDNVWLVNGYSVIDDPDYGECVSISDTLGLHKAIAHNLIFNKPRLTVRLYPYHLQKPSCLRHPVIF